VFLSQKSNNSSFAPGRPTNDDIIKKYPPDFTWHELKTFIHSGDLNLLKRNQKLEADYIAWCEGINKQYGSNVNYLVNHRLQWGRSDRLAILPSARDGRVDGGYENGEAHADIKEIEVTASAPSYFTADMPPELISVIRNDWPYSVPIDVEHSLVWTRVPFIDHSKYPPEVTRRFLRDGLWGFTGLLSPPPSPSALPSCLPALAPWGITMENLTCPITVSEEDKEVNKEAALEIDRFVRRTWVESEWETAWFLNPPRLQSVPDLSHIHVFARHKSTEEIALGL